VPSLAYTDGEHVRVVSDWYDGDWNGEWWWRRHDAYEDG
jgi:hypothetical protein